MKNSIYKAQMDDCRNNQGPLLQIAGNGIGRFNRQTDNNRQGDGVYDPEIDHCHRNMDERRPFKGRPFYEQIDQTGQHFGNGYQAKQDRHFGQQ